MLDATKHIPQKPISNGFKTKIMDMCAPSCWKRSLPRIRMGRKDGKAVPHMKTTAYNKNHVQVTADKILLIGKSGIENLDNFLSTPNLFEFDTGYKTGDMVSVSVQSFFIATEKKQPFIDVVPAIYPESNEKQTSPRYFIIVANSAGTFFFTSTNEAQTLPAHVIEHGIIESRYFEVREGAIGSIGVQGYTPPNSFLVVTIPLVQSLGNVRKNDLCRDHTEAISATLLIGSILYPDETNKNVELALSSSDIDFAYGLLTKNSGIGF